MTDPFNAGLWLGIGIGWALAVLIWSYRYYRKEQKLLNHWLRTIEMLEQSEANNDELRERIKMKLLEDSADWWKGPPFSE